MLDGKNFLYDPVFFLGGWLVGLSEDTKFQTS